MIHTSTSIMEDNEGAPPLLRGIASLWTSGAASDLIVKCGVWSKQVHSCILGTQSDFFARACEGPFRVKYSSLIRYKGFTDIV